MVKELELLEELKVVLKTNPGTKRYYDIFETSLIKPIETALKRIPELEKEIEDTHKAYTMAIEKHTEDENEYIKWVQEGGYDKNKLKALKIIKDCLVSEFKLFEKDGEYFILFYFDEIHQLTFKLKDKEEYDLLKEVFE